MKIDRLKLRLVATAVAVTTIAAELTTAGCQTASNAADADAGLPVQVDSGSNTNSGSASDAAIHPVACLADSPDARPLCGPAPEGEDAGAYAKCASQCNAYAALFKTEVARGISHCIDFGETCESDPLPCVDVELAHACPDESATTFCNTLINQCTDAGVVYALRDCTVLVRALNANGKATLETCVADGGACGDCLATVEQPR